MQKELCDIFFSRLYFSLESSGLGYIKLGLDKSKISARAEALGLRPELFEQACDSAIRILGDLFRHEGSDYEQVDWAGYSDAKPAFKKFVRALSKNLNLKEQSLGNELF